MTALSRTVLALYLLGLLWLVLFKFSSDFSSVLDHHARVLDLVPFSGSFREGLRERIDNILIFIPFGLLLSVNFKQATFWRKLAFILAFSIVVEATQFMLAIGASDVTDVITNTLGGLAGLALYGLGCKYVAAEKVDRFVVMAGTVVLTVFLLLRILVFHVRY